MMNNPEEQSGREQSMLDHDPSLQEVMANMEFEIFDEREDEHVLAGLALRDDLTKLAQGLPAMLKYPSHLVEAQSTIYGTVLTLLLDRGVPKELADPVREFLNTFHNALEHRQQATTWSYNGQWFAARVVR